jgi:hypothetical protein
LLLAHVLTLEPGGEPSIECFWSPTTGLDGVVSRYLIRGGTQASPRRS